MTTNKKGLVDEYLSQRLSQTKMFVTVKFNFYLRNYRRSSDGKSQVYLNITCGRQRKRVKTEVFVLPGHWDKKKQKPKPKLVDENLILDGYRQRLNAIIIEYKLKGKHLTIEKLMKEYSMSFSRFDFISFFEDFLEKDKSLYKTTYKKERAILNKLKRWKKEILFCDIDQNLIQDYLKFLQFKENNNENTAMSNLRTFKKYLRIAKKHDIEFPIDLEDISVKHVNSKRTNLTIVELKKVWDFYFTDISDRYKYIIGYFLFACFTGLRASDLKELNRDQIKEKAFTIDVKKTGRPLNVLLSKKAQIIIADNKDLFEKKVTNEYINRELKTVMAILGIKKNVSLHVARHTFAANYCRAGGNVVDLMNLLGHKSLKVTMEYTKIPYDESSKNIYILDDIFDQKEE